MQGGNFTYPRSHSRMVIDTGLESIASNFQPETWQTDKREQALKPFVEKVPL